MPVIFGHGVAMLDGLSTCLSLCIFTYVNMLKPEVIFPIYDNVKV
jgi:hypothetical protein